MINTNEHPAFKNTLELLSVSEMHHHPGHRIYAHARKTFGLIYVLSGSAVYEFDGIPYPVKEGDLFCIPQKIPFSLRPVEKKTYHTRQFGIMIYEPKLHMQMKTLHPPLAVDSTLKSMLDYIYKNEFSIIKPNLEKIQSNLYKISSFWILEKLSSKLSQPG